MLFKDRMNFVNALVDYRIREFNKIGWRIKDIEIYKSIYLDCINCLYGLGFLDVDSVWDWLDEEEYLLDDEDDLMEGDLEDQLERLLD